MISIIAAIMASFLIYLFCIPMAGLSSMERVRSLPGLRTLVGIRLAALEATTA